MSTYGQSGDLHRLTSYARGGSAPSFPVYRPYRSGDLPALVQYAQTSEGRQAAADQARGWSLSDLVRYALTPEGKAYAVQQMQQQKTRDESVSFYMNLGYPDYAGKYDVFAIPEGSRVTGIKETTVSTLPKGFIGPPGPGETTSILQVSFTSDVLEKQLEQQPAPAMVLKGAESLLHPLKLPVPTLPQISQNIPIPEKGIAETLMEFTIVPLLQRVGLPAPLNVSRSLVKAEPREVKPLASIAGLIAPGEVLIYSVGKLAGYKTPELPPTLLSFQAEKALSYGPEYAAGTLLGDILLGYGIVKVSRGLFPGIGEEFTGYAKTAISKVGDVAYQKIIEPGLVKPLAKDLLGEEAFLYGRAVEGQTPYQLLRLGITKEITAPLFHGFLETVPENWANIVMFTKSVVAPNIKDLGAVLETSVIYQQVLVPVGSSAKQVFVEPFSVGIEQATFAVKDLGFSVRFGLADVYERTLQPLASAVEDQASVFRGGMSFLSQTTPNILSQIDFEPIVGPARTVLTYGKSAFSYGKGFTSFMEQAPWSAETTIGKPVITATDALGKVERAAAQGFESARQTLFVPLKSEAIADIGMLRFRADLSKAFILKGLQLGFSPFKLLPEPKTIMKPWGYPRQKAIQFDIPKFEQPKIMRTGITPISTVQTENVMSNIQKTDITPNLVQYAGLAFPGTRQRGQDIEETDYLHFPTQGFNVSRLAKTDLSLGKSSISITDLAASLTNLGSGLDLGMGVKSAMSMQQSSQQLERQMEQQQQKLEMLNLQLPGMDLLEKETFKFPVMRRKGSWEKGFIWEFPVKGPREVWKKLL